MKILVAEDEPDNARLLADILAHAAHEVDVVHDGKKALEALRKTRYDALLTDWMMPEMDGVELIRRVRIELRPSPLILMITAIGYDKAREYVLQAGADDYIVKPYTLQQVLKCLDDGLLRWNQPAPSLPPAGIPARPISILPPFVGVVVAASTGGPPALTALFRSLPRQCAAAFFVVQHGPAWMLDMFALQLQRDTGFEFLLAREGMVPETSYAYLAPGDRHMCVQASPLALRLNAGAPENFVRPAADPLFRSASQAFGRFCVAAVLTGMGRDGAQGVIEIKSGNGVSLAQDPETAMAPSMPRTVIAARLADKILPLTELGAAIAGEVARLSAELKFESRIRANPFRG